MASLAYAEALRAAVRVEENGALFYRKAAAGSSDPDAARTFATLAKFEEEHRGYFYQLSLELEQRESLFINDPKGEFAASITRLADSGVYGFTKDPSSFFDGNKSTYEAVEFAVGMEKDSIVFYLGLQEAMADSEEAAKVGGIMKEEMRHLAILSDLLGKLQGQRKHQEEK